MKLNHLVIIAIALIYQTVVTASEPPAKGSVQVPIKASKPLKVYGSKNNSIRVRPEFIKHFEDKTFDIDSVFKKDKDRFAVMGTQDGGGGDPKEYVEKLEQFKLPHGDDETPFEKTYFNNKPTVAESLLLLTGYLKEGINKDIAEVIRSLPLNLIENQKVRAKFKQMMDEGLYYDVMTSPIRFYDNCRISRDGEKISRTGTTLMHQKSSPICIVPYDLAEVFIDYAQLSVLYGFLIHEYVHHFGYEDKDYEIAVELSRVFIRYLGHSNFDPLGSFMKISQSDRLKEKAERLYNHNHNQCLKSRTCFPFHEDDEKGVESEADQDR